MKKINYNDVKALFFDVGNTLTSVDFEWISGELIKIGIRCDAEILHRAETAALPEISTQIVSIKNDPSVNERLFYIKKILDKLPSAVKEDIENNYEAVQNLVQDIFSEKNIVRLWSYVLPGTHEALTMFISMGYQMHVISNSMGFLEERLIKSKLKPFFDVVIDSRMVNIEKPDPRIFTIALETANCLAEESLYIGNFYHIDIIGAKSAGMQAVLLDPFSDWKNVDCECVPDLLTLAEKLKNSKS